MYLQDASLFLCSKEEGKGCFNASLGGLILAKMSMQNEWICLQVYCFLSVFSLSMLIEIRRSLFYLEQKKLTEASFLEYVCVVIIQPLKWCPPPVVCRKADESKFQIQCSCILLLCHHQRT